jgi:hypothetical protein
LGEKKEKCLVIKAFLNGPESITFYANGVLIDFAAFKED